MRQPRAQHLPLSTLDAATLTARQIEATWHTHTGQYLETYDGHSMAVYTVRWNTFHPDIFISSYHKSTPGDAIYADQVVGRVSFLVGPRTGQ